MDDLKNKNVLITGGAGFIGSALVRELLNEGANVVVYDNFLRGSMLNLKDVADKIMVIKGDILDENFVNVLKENNIEYVFNYAANPYIPECYDYPHQFLDVNTKGTLNVMLCCKETGVKRILHCSSSEVYGTCKQAPMDEHHPTLPHSTYAVSKLAADRICFTLFHEQNIPIIILRQFNCYGPRETHPYIIPELITQLSQTNELRLGNIEARRDFTYVEDSARASVSLIKYPEAVGETFNVGNGKDWSVKELAEMISKFFGHDSIKIEVEKKRLRPLDVEKLQSNYFKLHNLTGWKPLVGIEEGLKKTINYFKENNHKWVWEFTPGLKNHVRRA
ncbi:MAG: SDR family NAD(P)-dependent oxidoreductase [Nanoarchaeota archaeon]|nr:SDR family NAD(P)-dependent oxidoreductase [Nanoarchaeota archaeon]